MEEDLHLVHHPNRVVQVAHSRNSSGEHRGTPSGVQECYPRLSGISTSLSERDYVGKEVDRALGEPQVAATGVDQG
jgi:hypothetical protein